MLIDFNAWSPSGGYEAELENWTFENSEKWDEMFATAGYQIDDRAFGDINVEAEQSLS